MPLGRQVGAAHHRRHPLDCTAGNQVDEGLEAARFSFVYLPVFDTILKWYTFR